MVSFLAIGFLMLGIGIRLMTLRNNLRRAGNVQAAVVSGVLRDGLLMCLAGLIALIPGIYYSFPKQYPEARILTDTGAALIYVGLLSVIQWAVQSGHGNMCQVGKGAWVAALIGVGFFIVYVILRLIGLQF